MFHSFRSLSSELQGVIVSALAGLVCLAIYSAKDATDVSSFSRITVKPESVYFVSSGKSDKIRIEANGIKYEIPYTLWKGRHETQTVVNVLERSSSIELWLKRGYETYQPVRGVRAEGLTIDPELGAQMDNSNRNVLLWIMLFFFGLGAIEAVREMVNRKKTRRLRH